jgi:hypothetical protein
MSTAAWPSTRSLQIALYAGSTQKGTIVTFREGTLGFSSSNTSTYQQIVGSMDLFKAAGLTTINRIRITVAGTGAAIGFYFDDFTLQGGLPQAPPSIGMVWSDPWSSTRAYNRNDTVTYNGATWVAKAANTNSAPTLTNTNWAQVAVSVPFCLDAGSNDSYACSMIPAITGYVIGQQYRFKANTANTGAATLQLNSITGAKTVKKLAGGITTDLDDNDIRAGQWVDIVWDGTNMQMVSQLGNAPASTVVTTAVYRAAICSGGSGSIGMTTDSSGYPSAVCVIGTNQTYGVASFADTETEWVKDLFVLPAGLTGNIDMLLFWETAATSGSCVWQLQTACIAPGESQDPAWNAAQTVTSAAGGTAYLELSAEILNVTQTGCAENEVFSWKLLRDPTHVSDDLGAAARLKAVRWTVRHN